MTTTTKQMVAHFLLLHIQTIHMKEKILNTTLILGQMLKSYTCVSVFLRKTDIEIAQLGIHHH